MQLNNPLLPDYNFDAHLVAGLTPIEKDSELDYIIDRPNGMKGFIINITTQGRGTIFRGDHQFDVGPGDLLLFPPKAAHFYHRHESEPNWYHRWIYFQPRGFWSDLLNWQINNNSVFLTQGLDSEHYQSLDTLFKEVESTSKKGTSFSRELSINLLEQLLIRCKMLQPECSDKQLDPRILGIINIMSNNIRRKFTIEELAAQIYLSPSRLAHLFREEMSMTIIQWRNDQRINYAKQLLTTSQVPVSKIGRMAGFSDPLYFSRVFKKHVGTSPTDFRRRLAEI